MSARSNRNHEEVESGRRSQQSVRQSVASVRHEEPVNMYVAQRSDSLLYGHCTVRRQALAGRVAQLVQLARLNNHGAINLVGGEGRSNINDDLPQAEASKLRRDFIE